MMVVQIPEDQAVAAVATKAVAVVELAV